MQLNNFLENLLKISYPPIWALTQKTAKSLQNHSKILPKLWILAPFWSKMYQFLAHFGPEYGSILAPFWGLFWAPVWSPNTRKTNGFGSFWGSEGIPFWARFRAQKWPLWGLQFCAISENPGKSSISWFSNSRKPHFT